MNNRKISENATGPIVPYGDDHSDLQSSLRAARCGSNVAAVGSCLSEKSMKKH